MRHMISISSNPRMIILFLFVIALPAAGVLLLRCRRGLRRTRGFPISPRPDEPREAGERRSGKDRRDQHC